MVITTNTKEIKPFIFQGECILVKSLPLLTIILNYFGFRFWQRNKNQEPLNFLKTVRTGGKIASWPQWHISLRLVFTERVSQALRRNQHISMRKEDLILTKPVRLPQNVCINIESKDVILGNSSGFPPRKSWKITRKIHGETMGEFPKQRKGVTNPVSRCLL